MSAFDIDAIVERATRREAALKSGFTPKGSTGYAGIREDADAEPKLPLIYWPLHAHVIKRLVCWKCGSRAIETDAPYGEVKSGECRCLLCGRRVAKLRLLDTRPSNAPVVTDEDVPAHCMGCGVKVRVRQARCNACRLGVAR